MLLNSRKSVFVPKMPRSKLVGFSRLLLLTISITLLGFAQATAPTTKYLESVTFDTESNDGFAINSIYWEGTLAAGSTIGFQLAVATSTDFSGVDFLGEDGSITTIYNAADSDGSEAIPVNGLYHHPFESGYRYFRYRVYLDKTSASPEVTKISINWTK